MLELIRGVHPPERKLSKKSEIKQAEMPKKVVIPLSQHTGKPCSPIVNVGDEVKIGQKIAQADAFVSAPIHASISGKVTEIGKKPHPGAGEGMAIVIESNGKMIWDESIKPRENVEALSSKELIEIVKQAGIVGMGGAMFPTHVKFCPPEGKKIDTIIPVFLLSLSIVPNNNINRTVNPNTIINGSIADGSRFSENENCFTL